METLEQYKNRKVLAELKSSLALLHSAKIEAASLQLTSVTDIETAETALLAAIDALKAELEA